jgi:predicted RNA-binding Zn-ribbon protein involved in translation (DUF1610 family)
MKIKCKNCKKEVETMRGYQQFCSINCGRIFRINKTKKDPILYKRFKKLDNERKHKYRFGTRDLTEIFNRFNGKCKFCGIKAQVIHHIDGNGDPRDKETLNNNIDNLIPLCRACHARLHLEQGDLNLKYN